ncbi:MAG: alcohol dehydrogenase catalytic domain-containing protein, partial [Myxococcales bacterium]|nr:alcohol dehydrogenase catalytic domain-containing protein [Myxococcales bacterium]
MQALTFSRGSLRVEKKETPARAPGEALIAVRVAGVCNTDLEIVRGYMGFEGTLGHEFVGEVIEADDVSWLGRRVCGDINLACGTCESCRAGEPHHCPNRSVLGILHKDGAFAERLTLPLRNLFAVPDAVSDEEAVF